MTEENAKLVQQLQQANKAKDVTNQLSQYQEALQRAEDELGVLRVHCQQSADENSRLHDQLADLTDVNNQLDELKHALCRAESDLSSSQNQLQCSQEESRQMAEENRKMMGQLQQASEQIYQLEQS